MDFVSINFETANAKRTSACSIGMARVRDGKIVDTFNPNYALEITPACD